MQAIIIIKHTKTESLMANQTYHQTDSVQEIASKDPSFIPLKFIRAEEDKDKDLDLSLQYSSQIPVIDISLLSNAHRQELQKLDEACQQWGFFLAINHGITTEVLQSVKNAASGFFNLPLQEKKQYSFDPVTTQGYGVPYAIPENQTSDWSDALFLKLFPTHLQKTELWPTTPPYFKEAIKEYGDGVRKVAERLFGSLSLIMGMETEQSLLKLHKEMSIIMRVNYYPKCSKPDQVLGLSPHSDANSISILLQDDNVTALQIRHDDGWVDVKPMPNSLVVNVGDVLEIWSNGRYKSIEHRALANRTRTRLSFASGILPDMGLEIEPLDEMIKTQQNKTKKYKKIVYGDYLNASMHQKLEGKEYIQKYAL